MLGIIQKLKGGDTGVYRQIVKNRYSYFYNMACSYMQDQEMAKEVVQDVFLKLWEGRASLADDTVIDSFLARLVKNRSIDYIRSRNLQLKNHSDYASELADAYWVEDSKLDEFSYEELIEKVNRAIAGLPEQTRHFFMMSRIEGMKYREISEKSGVSQKAVEYHISKALQILREKLGLCFIFLYMILGCIVSCSLYN